MKEIKLNDIKKEDLTYFGERAEPCFTSAAIISGMQDREKSLKFCGLKTIVRWLQLNYYFYQFTTDLREFDAEVTKILRKNDNRYVDALILKCIEAGNKLREVSVRLGKMAYSSMNRREMMKVVSDYALAVSDYTVFYQVTFFDGPILKLAEEVVGKYATGGSEAEKLFNLVSVAERLTAAENEQDDFLRIAVAPENAQRKMAEAHAEEYGWLSVRYFLGDAWRAEEVLERLRGLDKAWAANELKSRLSHREKREKAIAEAIEHFTEDDKQIVGQIRKIVYLRTQRGDFLHESAALVRPLLDKVAESLGVPYLGLINLSAAEIVDALEGKIDYKKHIENRAKNFLIYHNWQNGGEVIEGKAVDDYLKNHSFLRTDVGKVSEFSGKTGYKGHATGTVKVVKANSDIGKVERGDIVVTAMTTSNLLPALEKASAFITDEGSITCHAAIMAREMRKPCIVGTKIATRVLKDGDEVEVDADKGVVKIIKKA